MPVHRIDYRPKHLREKKRSAEAQKEKEQP
jgi:hypothetical protein